MITHNPFNSLNCDWRHKRHWWTPAHSTGPEFLHSDKVRSSDAIIIENRDSRIDSRSMLSLSVFFTGNVLTFIYFIPEMLTYSNELQSLPPGANQVLKHQGLWRTWHTQPKPTGMEWRWLTSLTTWILADTGIAAVSLVWNGEDHMTSSWSNGSVIKHLLHKCEDLSSDPSVHLKNLGKAMHISNASSGRDRGRSITRIYWLYPGSRSSERLSQQTRWRVTKEDA